MPHISPTALAALLLVIAPSTGRTQPRQGNPPEIVRSATSAVAVQASPHESSNRAQPAEWLGVRLGVGAGVGTPGALAGSVHLTLDAAPWRYLALGLEAVSAGTTTLHLLDLNAHDSLRGLHGRLVGRWFFVRDRLLLTTALAIGVDSYRTARLTTCPDHRVGTETDTYCDYEGPGAYISAGESSGVGLGYAGEVGVSGRIGIARLGAVLRIDTVADRVGTLIFGPTLAVVWH